MENKLASLFNRLWLEDVVRHPLSAALYDEMERQPDKAHMLARLEEIRALLVVVGKRIEDKL